MDIQIILMNFSYALFGAVLTLFFMISGYFIFDKITPYETNKALENGNIAVGIVVGSIFIGIGTSIGLVIGLGLN